MESEWNEERLESLVRDKVPEDRYIDYKRDLPSEKDDDKREFLNDVTAFANTFGGTILFGIAEEEGTGFPKEIYGCDISKPDEVILRLSNIIQSSVEPRLASLRFETVDLRSGKRVLVVIIPQSPAAPHMVKRGSPKFYMRGAAGKQPMDVHDIRAAFLASETISERIRDFRLDRMAKLAAGGSPIPLYDTTAFVAHIIPLAAFTRRITLDVAKIQEKVKDFLKPLQWESGYGPDYSLEGFAQVACDRERKALSYTLLFQNGCVETVDAYSMCEFNGARSIQEVRYGQELRELLPRIFSLYESVEIPFPCFLALSLINVKGLCIPFDHSFIGTGVKPIDRDHILLPERELIDRPDNVDTIIRPLFDLVWNACGLPRSRNFDAHGNWKPPLR